MNILDRYSWIVFIVLTSAVILAARRELGMPRQGAFRPLTIANLPWIVTGIGMAMYRNRSSFDLF